MPSVEAGIPQTCILNLLRDKGYSFRKQTDKRMVYKKGGCTPVLVPRSTMLAEETAKALLNQLGVPAPEIANFISTNRKP
jgi:hypothetical protein